MPNPLSLTKFDQSYLDLLEQLEDSEGELTPEMEEKLNTLTAIQVKNVETYILSIKHFDATIAAMKELEGKFRQKRLSIEKEKDRWKIQMIQHLDTFGYKTKMVCEIGKVNAQGKKKIAEDIRVEDLEPKYLIIDIRVRDIERNELERKLASEDIKVTLIKEQVDKEMLLDDMMSLLKQKYAHEIEQIEQEMWEGLIYTDERIPGGRMTVSKFPRIY